MLTAAEDALHTAVRMDDVEETRRILFGTGALDVNAAESGNGWAALHYAAANGFLAVMDVLVRAGNADIEIQAVGGYRPLHYASIQGHTGAVTYLLDQGADPNARDREDMTPLHHAAKMGELDCAAVLAKNPQCDKLAQDIDGLTPYDRAIGSQQDTIAELLRY